MTDPIQTLMHDRDAWRARALDAERACDVWKKAYESNENYCARYLEVQKELDSLRATLGELKRALLNVEPDIDPMNAPDV